MLNNPTVLVEYLNRQHHVHFIRRTLKTYNISSQSLAVLKAANPSKSSFCPLEVTNSKFSFKGKYNVSTNSLPHTPISLPE